ncbi:ArnT family glycosyltransferase [Sanguibacter antarcticus]|uniref:4-amino-4-deoxy-L-arabinose transferase-like glycosyltransferase n=1 Tax=Sanguibacter antarcticus TaxID=372484 RepID=A0A2A9E5E2_9MICO|nr:glycosyltransferase family 39 protein [Sanguibacter antarcticus]PFG33771.1 4-amino-4-deoxy-L-arabinose transferase-like glycosyltransferase [Sanguibacter antarcticus]
MTVPPSTEVEDGVTSPSAVPIPPTVPPTSAAADTFVPAPRERWERPALIALLVTTGVLYLWDLSASGWANSFYAAAVQAGSVSWKAFLFGASDAAASITVDKPPASLWIMALSVRIFGLNSWAMLVPQALMGVATVGIVYSSVRRYFSAQAGLIAGAVLALTPVAALMFRYNNPDALLVLLLTLAVALTIRGVEDGRTRWLVIAGALIGFAFLTKQLQAVLVLPGIAVVYLVAAPISIWHRIRDSLLALVAMVVTAGWWVAIVELTPAADRPYVGGSTNNSFFDLTFGYNGLGRIFGRSAGTATGTAGTGVGAVPGAAATGGAAAGTGRAADAAGNAVAGANAVGGGAPAGGGGGGFGSNVGVLRMFSGDLGGHVSWVIPAALLLGLFGLWILGRKVRTDVRRAALLLWGATLVVSGLTFSLMDGTFHQYYTVALAPSIGAVVGIGAWLLWTRRTETWALPLLAAVSLVTTGWAFIVLARSPEWNPWLRWVVLVVGLLAVAGLLLGRRFGPAVLRTGVVLALVAAFAGPTSWTVQTVLTPHTGGAVTTGPAVEGSASGARGGAAAGAGALPGGAGGPAAGQARGGQGAAGELPGGEALGGQDAAGQAAAGAQGAGANGRGSTTVSDTIVEMLLTDADSYTWVAATTDAQSAASYQLPTEKSVMPIGGFNGGDPSPTLEQFQAYVADGEIHYYIANGSGAGAGLGGGRASEEGTTTIATWVSETYTAETVDGVTIYDLTVPIG